MCAPRVGHSAGCTVFYRDPQCSEWISDIAEWAHSESNALHEQHGIAYTSGKWPDLVESVESVVLNKEQT